MYYRIGHTNSSNALESNSVTETETKIVLEDGITIGGKRIIEHLEAIGYIEYLYQLIKCITITQDDLRRLQHLFYFSINENAAGVYRDTKAIITRSKYALSYPGQFQDMMDELVALIAKLRKNGIW